jgi:site-specific DNA recombinase
MLSGMQHVAIYGRLSPRTDDEYGGVDAQIRRGRDYAAKTWPGVPVKVYRDDGISAAEWGKARSGYEELVGDVDAGQVAQIWTVEQSRLQRDEAAWFQLAAQLDAAGIREVHTHRDGVVRVRDLVAGIKAVVAADEARRTRQRVRDRMAELAAAGEPAGVTPFGYLRAVKMVNGKAVKTYDHDPVRAPIVAETAERILTGWRLAAIERDLAARGIVGNRSGEDGQPGPPSINGIRSMVTNPAVAGRRVHQGEDIGRGNWTPILDVSTWQAVRARLAEHTTPGPRRRYELSGWLVCARDGCELQLKASPVYRPGGRVEHYYRCPGSHCSVRAAAAEAYVAGRLLAELDKPAFRAAVADDEHDERRGQILAELDASEGRRREYAAQAARRELDPGEWTAFRTAALRYEEGLRAELAALPAPAATIDLDGLAEAWEWMTTDERRELYRLFVARVVVVGGRAPVGERLRVEWRTR